ncbi:MAG: TetR/AcrR family transcriptional regulator [Actinomycetota bacterium]
MSDLAQRRLPPFHRRRTLLQAAERTFAERGFDGARLDDIARAAGVTKAIVYRHFTSKDELFLETMREACQSLEQSMEAAMCAGGSLDAVISRCLRVWFDFVAERRSGFALVAGHGRGTDAALELSKATRDRIVRRIADAIPWRMRGVDQAEARRIGEGIVRSIVGAAEAVAAWWSETKPYPVEVAWLTVVNVTWLGIDRLVRGDLWLPSSEEVRSATS